MCSRLTKELSILFAICKARGGCEGHKKREGAFRNSQIFPNQKNVRYLSWEDAFDVEYDDGLCILEPHATIRKANKISTSAKFERLEIEDWTRGGFLVHYDNGQTAEVSWSFIRELPPKNSRK